MQGYSLKACCACPVLTGTSCLDYEEPLKENYNRSRRIKRGLFRSDSGQYINADIGAAYQIIVKAGYEIRKQRTVESIRVIKVA